jgi:hypothetical protein
VSSTECQACGALTGDGTLLCKDCTQKLGEALIKVSWLVRELEVAYIRAARFTRPSDSLARSRTQPLPWDERASAMVLLLRSTIRYWAMEVHSRTWSATVIGPERPLPDDTWRRALYLAGNLPRLRSHHDVARAHKELTGAIGLAQVTVDRPPDMLAYGICGSEQHNKIRCSGYLYAAPGDLVITCPKCRTEYDMDTRRRWMLDYVRRMSGTAVEIAGYLRLVGMKVTVDSIKGLVRRERLFPVPNTDLYRFQDVIDAVSTRYQRKPKVAAK